VLASSGILILFVFLDSVIILYLAFVVYLYSIVRCIVNQANFNNIYKFCNAHHHLILMKKMIKNTGYSYLDIVNRYVVPMYRYRVPMGYRYHIPMGYRYRVVEPADPLPLWVPVALALPPKAAPLGNKKK
jgi:hypothetical protein